MHDSKSLIQPEALDKSRVVRVRYVHGDVVNYSLVSVAIKYRGQKHRVEVAVSPHLRHPLILGTNWPGFLVLLGQLCADISWNNREQGKGGVTQVREAEPGPMGAETGERSAVVRRNLTECE